ncbi:MAG: four-carbon acid sugar kinase family protein [Candidatus Methylomirabilales bacterium]
MHGGARQSSAAARPARLAVIADDLTGANDTGVQFARRGARTVVCLAWQDLSGQGEDADVLVLNTASRALPARAAARRVTRAARAALRAKIDAVYKKVDSTLRGNIGAELEALLHVFPSPLAVLAPAFPPAGRTVRDGRLLVHGTPVHRTAAGTDPVTPVRESHLPTLLAGQVARPIFSLGLDVLRGSPARLAAAVRAWRAAGPGLVVADAETPEDLRRLARLVLREALPVSAGSAGLALALSQAQRWARRGGRRRPRTGRPILLVVGSPNPVSLEQAGRVEREGAFRVAASLPDIQAGGERCRRELSRVVASAACSLGEGRDTLVTLAQGRRRLRAGASARLSRFLGQAAARLARRAEPGGLVLCGGDIAVASCRALHASGVRLRGEIEPGLPWGELLGGQAAGLRVATKAGGFGTPEAFVRAARFLRGAGRRPSQETA